MNDHGPDSKRRERRRAHNGKVRRPSQASRNKSSPRPVSKPSGRPTKRGPSDQPSSQGPGQSNNKHIGHKGGLQARPAYRYRPLSLSVSLSLSLSLSLFLSVYRKHTGGEKRQTASKQSGDSRLATQTSSSQALVRTASRTANRNPSFSPLTLTHTHTLSLSLSPCF